MKVKTYNMLKDNEKEELYKFIKNIDFKFRKSFHEMKEFYEEDTFNKGKSLFLLKDEFGIKAVMGVITKEIPIKGEAYITEIYVKSVKECFDSIIQASVKYCINQKAKIIKLGLRTKEKFLKSYIQEKGFSYAYDAVIMNYSEDNYIKKSLDFFLKNRVGEDTQCYLSPLNNGNLHTFMSIYNRAFINSANGATLSLFDVQDLIAQYVNYEDLIGIANYQGNDVGVYQISIDERVAWIDILAVDPVFHNKGLGRMLMKKIILELKERDLDYIKLLVISSNYKALKLYENSGFIKEYVFSSWYELKNL